MYELADEVLGAREQKKAKVFDLTAAAAREVPYCQAMGSSIYHWWYLVDENLCVITDNHWFGGGPDGYRDRVLFLMGVALSWYTKAEWLHNEILASARTFTPTLSEKEVDDKIAPVLKRVQRAAAEEVDHYNGKEYDPRYNGSGANYG
jgi:hypothetical protein